VLWITSLVRALALANLVACSKGNGYHPLRGLDFGGVGGGAPVGPGAIKSE
jgi:hypothetical protein